MRISLSRLRDLTPDAGSDARNLVTGGRPMFALDSTPASGWYLITTDVVGAVAPGNLDAPGHTPVALRFLAETKSVLLARRPVPSIRGKRARVLFVPQGTGRVHLEVSPWLATVEASFVDFRAIPRGVAASIMTADVTASSIGGSTDRRLLTNAIRSGATSGRITNSARALRESVEKIAALYEHLQHRRSGDGVDYPSWRVRNATMFDDDKTRLRAAVNELPDGGPTISVVMPVYDPDVRWLRAAVESVLAQVYENWTLCVVNDASKNPRVKDVIDELAALDDRILVRHRTENGHIAAATNDGLEMATGEFVAFMDHDDELAPFALAVVALAAGDDSADVVYTDEDKIDSTGRHFDPHNKPPWNPELLLGQNYISHLTTIRRSVVVEAGGLRSGFDGAQDHDLLLRVTAAVPADRIVHVPFVAYHWRAIEGSTAMAAAEKNYTEESAAAALRDRLGPSWHVELSTAPNAFRCKPPLTDYPLVSILIPTRDRVDLLRECVDGLAKTTYPAFEVLIIDNDSTDPETLTWLEAFDNGHDHRVVRAPGPFNYSAVNNLGAQAARGELLLLLNNDIEVIEPNWLSEMVRWIGQPQIGAVGAKLLYPDDTIQHAGVLLGLGGLAGHGHHSADRHAYGFFSRLTIAHEVAAVTAACLLTRRSTWQQLGGLDEKLAVAFNDVDYCMRVRHEAGERIIWTPNALLYHHESVSRGAEDDPAKVARFAREVEMALDHWGDVLDDDPAYSPNLTLDGDSFTLARQPRVVAPWMAPS